MIDPYLELGLPDWKAPSSDSLTGYLGFLQLGGFATRG